jgi:hypothetical protein
VQAFVSLLACIDPGWILFSEQKDGFLDLALLRSSEGSSHPCNLPLRTVKQDPVYCLRLQNEALHPQAQP